MAVFLCAGLALGLSAGEINLPLNAKIGKTLEGKVLQEVLQKVANSKKGVVEKNISEWDAIRNAYNGIFQGDNKGDQEPQPIVRECGYMQLLTEILQIE